jgi:thymidylate synthase (FAD)
MKVILIQATPNPLKAVARAARLCYSDLSIMDLVNTDNAQKEAELVGKIVSLGHHSVLEHASFTSGIEGISRATSHQLVRHRIASYSQQSQRYVKQKGQFPYVIPPSIQNNPGLSREYEKIMFTIQQLYDKCISQDIPAEDARYLLPNACETKIITTMNARELRHFFRLRCCRRAQWEIRELAKEMLRLLIEKAPALFQDAGPACLAGSCPEGSLSCGHTEEVRLEFRHLMDNAKLREDTEQNLKGKAKELAI